MQSTAISDELNLYNKYTCDYRQRGSTRYQDFSPYSPFKIEGIQEYLQHYQWQGDRDAIYNVISERMRVIGATEEVERNLELLRKENTVAIVTGHQPALGGGPLFVFLKIASIIALARKLNALNLEYNFVPVFWVASEDHNFSEYNSLSFYDKANDLVTGVISGESSRLMALERSIASREELESILQSLPATEFVPEIIKEIYEANTGNLGEAFVRLINTWFGGFGLLLLEPGGIRKLAAPLIAKAIQRHQELVHNMNTDTAAMQEAGYTPQLPDAEYAITFVFYIADGQRYRINYCQERFSVTDLEIEFSRDELLQEIAEHPEKFSPVAGLRPIIQGAILPAAIYVAGGGELAYHVQLRRNFAEFGINLPLLLPRMAGTFITPSIKRILRKFSLAESDILSGRLDWEVIQDELAQSNSQLSGIFEGYADNFRKITDDMSAELQSLQIKGYKNLLSEAEKYISRFQSNWDRILQNNTPVGENAKNQFFKLYKFLLPAQKYQELTIAGIYFYSLLGRSFFDTICQTDVLANDHKIWIFD